jgi:hypothetical protein
MRKRNAGHPFAAVVLALTVSVAVLELGVRVWMPHLPFTEPIHDVLFLAPDPRTGWKLVEDFTFSWKGRNPYCIEFGVRVTTNTHGFRDKARHLDKPAGTVRIAVLGDSFIEGIQVPLEHTTPAVLETRLAAAFPQHSFEVMNFGVSNYGVGQYLLVYDAYVRAFKPDFVVVFASYLNFSRTHQRELSSRLQEFYALNVRPSFEVDERGQLVYVPANDYERYRTSVEALLQEEFGADRTVEMHPIWTPLVLPHWALNLVSRKARPSASPQQPGDIDFPHLDTNYRILQELNSRVRADGGSMVFADAFEYLERYGVVPGSGALVPRNRAFAEGAGAGHVDLSPPLRAADMNPQFECDMHFNTVGHRIVADALFDWFAPRLAGRVSRRQERPGR